MKENKNELYKSNNTIDNLCFSVKEILQAARSNAYRAVNFAMVQAYWQIGQQIVEVEQHGASRAAYGKSLLPKLSEKLTQEFGKGFDERELRRIRQFYLALPIRETLSPELSWSHYTDIIKVDDPKARQYYIEQASKENWSVRQLRRNISTLYYDRLLLSADKQPVVNEMLQKTASMQTDKLEMIKNPYVFEFLGLDALQSYKESQLEQVLIDNLQKFLLELGKGFAFVARQKMVRTDTAEFYIDLVFYNYLLKCFVVVELKTHALEHADVGQIVSS